MYLSIYISILCNNNYIDKYCQYTEAMLVLRVYNPYNPRVYNPFQHTEQCTAEKGSQMIKVEVAIVFTMAARTILR